MTNPYGVVRDHESLRWAAAESVSEAVIAAICLLEERGRDRRKAYAARTWGMSVYLIAHLDPR